MARKKHRRRNALNSIHDPPDPSPRVLPAQARAEWGDAYREAYEIYGKDDLAAKSAWREITLRWKQTGKKTWQRCRDGVCYWPSPMKLPMPKADLVGLGVLVEYVYLDKRGDPHVRELNRDHPPILWWDNDRKACYAFPKQSYPACQAIPPGMEEAVEVYRRWHQRDPDCFTEVKVPDVRITPVGAGDSMSYASDKWNDPDPDPALLEAQEYIHNHWYDVWVWLDTARAPNVIMIQGGELDLHERGLIH